MNKNVSSKNKSLNKLQLNNEKPISIINEKDAGVGQKIFFTVDNKNAASSSSKIKNELSLKKVDDEIANSDKQLNAPGNAKNISDTSKQKIRFLQPDSSKFLVNNKIFPSHEYHFHMASCIEKTFGFQQPGPPCLKCNRL